MASKVKYKRSNGTVIALTSHDGRKVPRFASGWVKSDVLFGGNVGITKCKRRGVAVGDLDITVIVVLEADVRKLVQTVYLDLGITARRKGYW